MRAFQCIFGIAITLCGLAGIAGVIAYPLPEVSYIIWSTGLIIQAMSWR